LPSLHRDDPAEREELGERLRELDEHRVRHELEGRGVSLGVTDVPMTRDGADALNTGF